MCWYRAGHQMWARVPPPSGAAIDAIPDRGLAWPHGSGLRFKRDDDVSWFGLVRLQAIRIGLALVGKIYNFGPRSSGPGGTGGLRDAESVAVEEECVLPEYVVQLRNHGVCHNCEHGRTCHYPNHRAPWGRRAASHRVCRC